MKNPHQLEILTDEKDWPFILLTDRWGDDSGFTGTGNPEKDTAAIQTLLPRMADEVTFIAYHRDLGYGLLFEVEHLHNEGSDARNDVNEAWSLSPDAAGITTKHCFAYLHDRIILPALQHWPDLKIWASTGPHVFQNRVGLYAFIPLGNWLGLKVTENPLLQFSEQIARVALGLPVKETAAA